MSENLLLIERLELVLEALKRIPRRFPMAQWPKQCTAHSLISAQHPLYQRQPRPWPLLHSRDRGRKYSKHVTEIAHLFNFKSKNQELLTILRFINGTIGLSVVSR